MTCPSSTQLDEIVAGGSTTPEISAHLESCPACRASADNLRRNHALLAELKPIAARRKREAAAPPPATLPAMQDAPKGYEVRSLIARGGQGVVYEAVHRATKRRVALKVLGGGVLAGERQRRRFEREIELVAGLRHPNIVTVYDSGTTPDGRHFLAMEYVAGETLEEHLGKVESRRAGTTSRKVEIEEVLRFFAKICDGVNFAHQRGIIHRDLKPANILVVDDEEGTVARRDEGTKGEKQGIPSLRASVPSSLRASPRILDFGLAKALDVDAAGHAPTVTLAGEFQGTLAYAAPEQVQGDPGRIDIRTDVYAIGVMLYEALTGGTPYPTAGAISDVVRAISEAEPARPSARNHRLDDELDTILLKALAKERERRYQSAGALADDLRHYLGGDPIHAKSDSAWYVLRKAARRHRIPLAAAAVLVVLLAGFAVTTSIQSRRIAAQRDELRQSLSESNIERGRLIGMTGSLPAAEELLWREFLGAPSPRSEGGDGAGLPNSPAYWALWELYSRQPCLATFRLEASRFCPLMMFTPDGQRLVSFTYESGFAEWETLTGRRRLASAAPRLPFTCAVLCPGGKSLVLGGEDGSLAVWDVNSGQSRLISAASQTSVSHLAISADGAKLASGGTDGTIRVFELASARSLADLQGYHRRLDALCLSSDGRMLASQEREDGVVKLWDVASGQVLEVRKGRPNDGVPLCFSPDGKTLANVDPNSDDIIILWDVAAKREGKRVIGHGGQVIRFAYSPDGRMLVVGGKDGVVKAFDLVLMRWVATVAGHGALVNAIRFSPDGRLLATGAADGTIRLWETPPVSNPQSLDWQADSILSVCFSPSGQSVAAAGGWEGVVGLHEPATGGSIRVLDQAGAPASVVSFHPRGDLLASGSQDGMVKLWDVPSGTLRESFRADDAKVACLAFSPDGNLLATSGDESSVKLWEVTQRVRLPKLLKGHERRVPCVAFSPDGETLASTSLDSTVMLWDVSTGARRAVLRGHQVVVRCVQFSPMGRLLVTSSDDQTLKLWEAATGRCLSTLKGHSGQVYAVCFSPDGRLLASGDRGGNIRLWDAASGRFLAGLNAPSIVWSLSFSPDGRTLAAGCGKPSPLLLWDLSIYDGYIAGNLEYQLGRVGIDTLDPNLVEGLREWAAGVLAR